MSKNFYQDIRKNIDDYPIIVKKFLLKWRTKDLINHDRSMISTQKKLGGIPLFTRLLILRFFDTPNSIKTLRKETKTWQLEKHVN